MYFQRHLFCGVAKNKTSEEAEKLELLLHFSYFAKLSSGPDWTPWRADSVPRALCLTALI